MIVWGVRAGSVVSCSHVIPVTCSPSWYVCICFHVCVHDEYGYDVWVYCQYRLHMYVYVIYLCVCFVFIFICVHLPIICSFFFCRHLVHHGVAPVLVTTRLVVISDYQLLSTASTCHCINLHPYTITIIMTVHIRIG
ncbi:hypothetical protein EON63_07725 [archaeon]|nr:MAG: hypothetical protein EON63_07725 [archaeon]